MPRTRPSIQPKPSGPSTASAHATDGFPVAFFQETSHTSVSLVWCSSSQAAHSSASRQVSSGKRGFAGQRAADQELLDLARPLVERRQPRVAEVLPDGILVDVPVAAVRLNGGVCGADGGLAREVLREGRLDGVTLSAIGSRRGAQDEQARRLCLDGDVGEKLLHELKARDRPAELRALLRVG